MPYFRLIFCCVLSIWGGVPFLSRAQEYIPNVVVVQFESEIVSKTGLVSLPEFDRRVSDYQVYEIERVYPFLDHVEPTPKTRGNLLALRRTYYVRYRRDVSPEQVSGDLDGLLGVVYSEPVIRNWIHTLDPSDPRFEDQTEFRHIRLPEAWEIVRGEQGSKKVVVAIVDTGTDWRHEDLRGNVWTNEGEIAGNGLDDDRNGFIDDVHGINFPNGDELNNDPSPLPGNRHGTNSSGFAGAVTNNGVGIAGAAWNADMMYVNVGCPDIPDSACLGYEGVLYAAANGADIINTSWGGLIPFDANARLKDISINLATDMGSLIVASAGNDSRSVDLYRHYPARHPRVLSVGSTKKDTRTLADFSNYGNLVNVFAPGEGILTTGPDNSYDTADGTSFSAPIVSGVAALVKAKNPDWTPDMIREQIRLTSENMDAQNPSFIGETGRGFVNALAAVEGISSFPAVRVKRWEWIDDDGNREILPGDAVTLTVVFVNYLASARDLRVGLTGVEDYPFLDWITREKDVGFLAGGEDSVKVEFSFRVVSDAPVNQRVRLFTQIREGDFFDQPDLLSFRVNQQIEVTHEILRELYRVTRGDSWTRNNNWNTATVPTAEQLNTWYGIFMIEGIFAELSLNQNNLNGRLPAELGGLTQLWSLELAGNSLEGEIPPELGKLSNLRRLELSENSLTGEIPADLADLAKVKYISLSMNSLSGSIPSELGRLSKVEALYLSNNSLGGKIPPELGNLIQLRQLLLSGNSLTGEIPSELGNLKRLNRLLLSRNSLTGEIPSELGNLTQLQNFYLEQNSLEGAIPSQLGNLVQMEDIILDGNSLSGAIPRELGNLAKLKRLSAEQNSLEGTIPSQLGDLASLQALYLRSNLLEGEIPSELGKLSKLQILSVAENSLGGEIPSELGSLVRLTDLNLEKNNLSGELPPELGNMAQLRGLYLHENSLTGSIPSEFGRLAQLRDMQLFGNALSGSIPQELGNLTQLRRLDIHENELSGALPSELGNLVRVEQMVLYGNQLSGTIPAELGNLSEILWLNLDSNNLSGAIPPELGKLTKLQRLFLGDNDLSGEIPPELGNLAGLQLLYLYGNKLTGQLPRSFLQLRNLVQFYFDGQDLCAPNDPEFQAWLGSIPSVQGETCLGISIVGTVKDQSYPREQQIEPLVLPEATGEPPIRYILSPALPAGLSFDPVSRTISGTPTEVMGGIDYTYTAIDAEGNSNSLRFSIEVHSPVATDQEALPERFSVHANYPNPFRHSTNIVLDLPWPARVQVEVLDILGRSMFSTTSADLAAGWANEIELSGQLLPAGTYFYRLRARSSETSSMHVGRFVRVR